MLSSLRKHDIPLLTMKNGKLTYSEVGEKTQQLGIIWLSDVDLQLHINHRLEMPMTVMEGSALVYDEGRVNFHYERLNAASFTMNIVMGEMNLMTFNQMVDPIQAVKIRSGQLKSLEVSFQGDSIQALGTSLISYNDLHLEIFKKNSPDQTNLGSSLLTLLADGIILKHSRHAASASFTQERIPHKSPVNYWVKSTINGTVSAVRKGKSVK